MSPHISLLCKMLLVFFHTLETWHFVKHWRSNTILSLSVSLFYYNLGSDDIQYLYKQAAHRGMSRNSLHVCACVYVHIYTCSRTEMISSAPQINVLLILTMGLTSDKKSSFTILLRSGVFVPWAFVLFITHFKWGWMPQMRQSICLCLTYFKVVLSILKVILDFGLGFSALPHKSPTYSIILCKCNIFF